jgi:hypothetical protein
VIHLPVKVNTQNLIKEMHRKTKSSAWRVLILTLFVLYFSPHPACAQEESLKVTDPVASDFSETLTYLSSAAMEGREAGKKGSVLASEYIAAGMKTIGLEPFGDLFYDNGTNLRTREARSWFMAFRAIVYKEYRDSITLIEGEDARKVELNPVNSSNPRLTDHFDGNLSDTVTMRNILGIIRGRDTTKSILIGAHYDHLGIRDGLTCFGADDNASGVAGTLALAGKWIRATKTLPVNLIFAAWAGEEKGLAGSEYFAGNHGQETGRILLCINMDMIAGSAPEDSLHKVLSIGTLPGSKVLRSIARKVNRSLDRPFSLDLWDVSGHTGSDYAWFARAGIPVMTFFSGYTDYYHTPGDVIERADLQKMTNILGLVNKCIEEILNSSGKRRSLLK